MVDPNLNIRGGARHPDPEIKGEGLVPKTIFFGPSGLGLV